MNSLGANTYAHTGSSSELVLSYSGESEPPSYSQLPQNSDIQPGKFVFRDVPTLTATARTTVIVPKDGSSPPIFNIVAKKLPMVSTSLIIIRKGPPELDGKLLATFELQGRDMIMIDSKSRNISSAFTYAKANFGVSQNFYQNFGNGHRWAREPADIKKIKQRPNLTCHPMRTSPIKWARFSFADPMLALWQPDKFLAEHELEVLPEGVNAMDECLVSLIVLLLVREDVLVKLGGV